MKSTNEDLIEALRILAYHIDSEDGVANACIYEAADRIEELTKKPEPEPIEPAYYVYRHGYGLPIKRHKSGKLATDEAKRLAQENPQVMFEILKRIALVTAPASQPVVQYPPQE